MNAGGLNEHVGRSRKRVIVVGGGIAGLAAAEAIIRDAPDRFVVTILEAKRALGGRAGSFTDPTTGHCVDYCQHVAMGCCTNLQELLHRNGLSECFRTYRELTFLHPEFSPSRFVPAAYLPPPLHLLPALHGLAFLRGRPEREIKRGIWKLMRSGSAELADVKAADWLAANGQGPDAIARFWDVILVSALGERTERVAMSAARKVLVDGFAAARGASDVLIPRRPLKEIFGELLPQSIADLGVEIHTSTAVSDLAGDRHQRVQVKLATGATVEADHVVVAVPWHGAGRLLSDPPVRTAIPNLREIETFPASPITGVHLWFDREITDLPHAVMVGTLAQWLFRDDARSDSNASGDGKGSGFYYQVVISGSHPVRGAGSVGLVDRLLEELRGAFPGARQARLIHSRVVTDPKSVVSISPSVEALRPTQTTALPWLHLAGDWTRTGWPATMEGAVISGRRAAASIFDRERLPAIQIDPGQGRGWLARRLLVK